MSATLITPSHIASLLRTRPADSHKGTFGHALLIAGQKGMAGAALLATKAALRSGVGKLTLHSPEVNLLATQIAVPEAIVHLDANSQDRWASPIDVSPYDAIALGPGIGTEGETVWALRTQLQILLEGEAEGRSCPLLIDADGINLLAQDFQLLSMLPRSTTLTPHHGEMKRLCALLELPHQHQDDLLSAAKLLSQELSINIVLKAHHSHVFSNEGEQWTNCNFGNSGMATAGSGDVLSGILLALMAQGYLPSVAAQIAVFLHARSGDIAAQQLGEHSLIASDIIRFLPQAFLETTTQTTIPNELP